MCIRDSQKAHGKEYGHIHIVLSTDSVPLQDMLQKAAPEIFAIARDSALAGDRVRKIDVIRDAAKRAETHFGMEYDKMCIRDRVHVEPGTHIGCNATVLQGIHIGSNTLIGAGSLVNRDLPENIVAWGSPCREVRSNVH